MPIDGFRALVSIDFANRFRNHDRLEWNFKVNKETSEIVKESSKYRDLRIEILRNWIIVRGSLHKFYTSVQGGVGNNSTDFTFEDVSMAIEELSSEFQISPNDLKIQTPEFGVNIKLKKPVKDFLSNNLILISNKLPTRSMDDLENGIYREFEYDEYKLKLYDKGKQAKIPDNLLRLEIKTKRTRFIRRYLKFDDFQRRGIYDVMKEKLFSCTKKLLIIDDFNEKNFENPIDHQILQQWSNPNQWRRFISECNNRKVRRQFNRVRETCRRNHLDSIYRHINERLESKWEQLMG